MFISNAENSFGKLLVMGQDGLRLHTQLKSLREAMGIGSEQHIEPHLPSRILEDINATSTIIRGRAQLDAKLDPLARFFTHAPAAKTLTIGQLPAPGEDGFPDTEVAARVLHFATDYQYPLYNVAGAYYDEHLQWQALRELLFGIAKGSQGTDRHAEEGHRCPQVREDCLTERDRLSYVNKEAGLIFCRQMSPDELNEVVPNSSESDQPDRAKWLERVVGWALEQRTSVQHSRDHGLSIYLLNNNAIVEEFTSRLLDTYVDLRITNAPGVMRLSPMLGEVKAGLSKTNTTEQQDRPAVFDQEGAEEALSGAEVIGIESSFLASYALTDIVLGIIGHDGLTGLP
ncbi:CCHC-type domain-containing protein [Fusarium sp. LHS14.1]|nr:CCHC-type domain-containing protein [Fusarium sp. LHS14.1]